MDLLMQLIIVIVLLSLPSTAVAQGRYDKCSDRYCGNVSIPYPFGKEGCNLSPKYLITCNNSVPFLWKSNIEIINISVDGQLEIVGSIVGDCYNASRTTRYRWWYISLSGTNFSISKSRNKFTVIGCDSYAYLNGYRFFEGEDKYYSSGCMSRCAEKEFVDNTSCSGSGCCQIQIPDGLYFANITAYSFNRHINVSDFNPCTYALIVEESKFTFTIDSLQNIPEEFPMVLEWTINNETNYCKDHATKYQPKNIKGYRCKCDDGYHGNPYLGCTDINECEEGKHNCKDIFHCVNNDGNYTCRCLDGYHGDGRRNGEGCQPNQKELPLTVIILGVGIGFTVLLFGTIYLYLFFRKRKLIKLKETFFKQNGGLLLRDKLAPGRESAGNSFAAKIFTAEELKKATNNYDDTTVVGKGGFGTVHKGVLNDHRVVAIKKSITIDKNQAEQFINEVVVLSQINHKNVVKLLGCCLETEVPLLVYEFVNNGTLFDYIHNESNESGLSWETRLRIAAETAEALSYLHSAASIPIIHRDIKTTNILLDANYTAKVSDFGASRLVPADETELTTMVQGTWGYLDPEYLHTNLLTEKSDVYSFGVVLIELLTSMKALSFNRPEEERSLAMYFLSSFKKGELIGVLDSRIVNEENKEQIVEVGRLAVRCLTLKGEERPSMKEVAMELEGLRRMEVHPWLQVNQEETQHLLGEPTATNFGNGDASGSSAGYDSIRKGPCNIMGR